MKENWLKENRQLISVKWHHGVSRKRLAWRSAGRSGESEK
jgi:hypothetical protein